MAVRQQINKFIQGIGASPGIVIGKAYLIERSKVRLPEKGINPGQVEEEVKRFLKAIQDSRDQLMEIKEKILRSRSESPFFHPRCSLDDLE